MKAKSIIAGLLILLIALVLIAMALPFFSMAKIGRPTRVQLDISNLIMALSCYESEYGVLPTGNSSNVIRALSGENPKKIIFLVYPQVVEHPNEMVDPWLTPYEIDFHHRTNFVIRSAGKNKTFGNSDDIVVKSVSNDFVKP